MGIVGRVGRVGFVGSMGFLLLLTAALSAQTPDIEKLQFEVASVKPNKTGDPNSSLRLQPGGRIVATNVALRLLIRNLYNVQADQIVGAPDWIESERFDIEAKADREYPPQADAPAPELLAMMRNLLADRFKLAVHRESREMPVYALVAARPDKTVGSQMRRVDVDCAAEAARAMAARRGGAPPPSAKPDEMGPCGMRMRPGNVMARGTTLQQLTCNLSQFVGRAVVDRTGLYGAFDIDLQWSPEQTADASGPSIFTAVQEQLGLKLESQRVPVDVLVVDKVEPCAGLEMELFRGCGHNHGHDPTAGVARCRIRYYRDARPPGDSAVTIPWSSKGRV